MDATGAKGVLSSVKKRENMGYNTIYFKDIEEEIFSEDTKSGLTKKGKKALKTLEINKEELMDKDWRSFGKKGESPEVKKVRYMHFNKKRKKLLMEVK